MEAAREFSRTAEPGLPAASGPRSPSGRKRKTGFEDFWSGKGRLNRLLYFERLLFLGVVIEIPTGLAMAVLMGVVGGSTGNGLAGMLALLVLGLAAVASICQTLQRLHDLDMSGHWFWLSLVPIAGLVLFLLLLFAKGTSGQNRYGKDPLLV